MSKWRYMYTKMVYKNQVAFDSYTVNEEEGLCWAEICEDCKNKYASILKGRYSDPEIGSEATCEVEGCSNKADGIFVDFKLDEVTFENF